MILDHAGKEKVENIKPHRVQDLKWYHGSRNSSDSLTQLKLYNQNHEQSNLTGTVDVNSWSLCLHLFLLLGRNANRTPKTEEVSSHDSDISKVSIKILFWFLVYYNVLWFVGFCYSIKWCATTMIFWFKIRFDNKMLSNLGLFGILYTLNTFYSINIVMQWYWKSMAKNTAETKQTHGNWIINGSQIKLTKKSDVFYNP